MIYKEPRWSNNWYYLEDAYVHKIDLHFYSPQGESTACGLVLHMFSDGDSFVDHLRCETCTRVMIMLELGA